MQPDINQLYEKYLTLNIPNPFTLEQINERLMKQYSATPVDVNRFDDLKKDPWADFHTAVAAYQFRNSDGVEKLLILESPDEKIEFYKECTYGDGCNLILNSEDQIYVSGGTIQVGTKLLLIELDIFGGIDKEDMVPGKEEFNDYLKALYLAGYIHFENDSFIEKARQRYREGYRLRRFGSGTSGETTF
ncbi:hypothetical protein J27TS7_54070 [Paenibacillus dendritiformis]|uniref:pyruvate kinase n=1 Tax=Paenibacillus dendritiformis TaxID=130049 RepID=UPI001B04F3D0|nr:pyruvate kinase [Paenibacillus dendritiformis]GIO75893.1 hypothetical protein J27TS7_54070 [Paenibacillus dendritiformis]